MTRFTRPNQFLLPVILASTLLAVDAWCQIRHGDRIVTVVNHASPNVRSAPRVSAETLMGTVPRGTQMKLVAQEGPWYRVIHPNGQTAYIFEDYAEVGIARDLVEVTVARAHLRESPTKASKEVGQVTRGSMLPLVRKSQNWFLVMLPGNQQGWLRDDLGILRPLASPLPEAPAAPPPSPESAAEPAVETQAEEAVRVDPYAEGRDLAASGDVEDAIAAFRRAVEADPAHSDAHFELAVLLKDSGQTDEAIVHFKAAGKGARPRPEARFYLEELQRTAGGPSEPAVLEDTDEVVDAPFTEDLLAEATAYVLPALGIGSLLFLVALGMVYRRRRSNQAGQPMYRRRKQDAGFDSVLKYAVEKRPLLRTIEEAERKRAEMDTSLQKQLETFQKGIKQGSPQLPGGESTETLLKRLDDLRQTILNQEERAKIYAELVLLQNEKLEALDEEIEALKKLIQLDYRDSKKQPKRAKPSEGGAAPS